MYPTIFQKMRPLQANGKPAGAPIFTNRNPTDLVDLINENRADVLYQANRKTAYVRELANGKQEYDPIRRIDEGMHYEKTNNVGRDRHGRFNEG